MHAKYLCIRRRMPDRRRHESRRPLEPRSHSQRPAPLLLPIVLIDSVIGRENVTLRVHRRQQRTLQDGVAVSFRREEHNLPAIVAASDFGECARRTAAVSDGSSPVVFSVHLDDLHVVQVGHDEDRFSTHLRVVPGQRQTQVVDVVELPVHGRAGVGLMTIIDGEEVATRLHFDPCPHVLVSIVALGEGSPEAVVIALCDLELKEHTGL